MTLHNPPRRHVQKCASTNDLARTWIQNPHDPAPHGAFVHADFQTAGRGRRGRQWSAAPNESVLVTVVLRPDFLVSQAWTLAFAAGLAVSDALVPIGFAPTLKWPNDVLLHGRKAAGVLVETVQTPHGWAAVVGIGVNVRQAAFPVDVDFAVPPTSLFIETGRAFEIAELTAEIAARVAQRAAQTPENILHSWREQMAAGIVLRRGAEQGAFVTVDDDGAARVRLPDNTVVRWTTVDGPPHAGAPLR